jgi:hypothetical protein
LDPLETAGLAFMHTVLNLILTALFTTLAGLGLLFILFGEVAST